MTSIQHLFFLSFCFLISHVPASSILGPSSSRCPYQHDDFAGLLLKLTCWTPCLYLYPLQNHLLGTQVTYITSLPVSLMPLHCLPKVKMFYLQLGCIYLSSIMAYSLLLSIPHPNLAEKVLYLPSSGLREKIFHMEYLYTPCSNFPLLEEFSTKRVKITIECPFGAKYQTSSYQIKNLVRLETGWEPWGFQRASCLWAREPALGLRSPRFWAQQLPQPNTSLVTDTSISRSIGHNFNYVGSLLFYMQIPKRLRNLWRSLGIKDQF